MNDNRKGFSFFPKEEIVKTLKNKSLSLFIRPLNSPFLTFILAGLYPPVFLASKNWFLYTGGQLYTLLLSTSAVVLCAGAIFHGVCWLLLKVATRLLKQKVSLPRQVLLHALAALFSFVTIVFLLQSSIFPESEKSALTIAIIILATIAILLFVAKAGLWRFNLILACIVSFAALGWGISHAQLSKKDLLVWYKESREQFRDVKFQERPNVYAIVMESYNNSEAMRVIYDFDNQVFVDELEERGVKVFPDCYANYNYSLQTLACLFTMQHHYYKTSVGLDDAFGARDIVGGKVYNPVLDVFKTNGYACQYIFCTDYCFNAGEPLSFTYPVPVEKEARAEVFDIYQLKQITDLLKRLVADRESEKNYKPKKGYSEVSDERILAAANSSKPYFTVLSPKAVYHTNARKRWSELAEWEEQYPKLIIKYNPLFISLIDYIVENDPNAIIIMFGDHGSGRYRGGWWTRRGDDLNAVLESRDIAGKTLALDQFGTFLGIRYPGGNPEQIAARSHVNLFRNLFATLSEDQSLLETSAANTSWVYQVNDKSILGIGVRDGELLDLWESIDEQE